MKRINAYSALILAACNCCTKFAYGFYADDATCTLSVMSSDGPLDIVSRFDGGYYFEGNYYKTAEEALDAAASKI